MIDGKLRHVLTHPREYKSKAWCLYHTDREMIKRRQ